MPITGLHHVQLAMPRGREEEARAFYAGTLGMTEVSKPENLAKRGGAWFSSGAAEVPLGWRMIFAPRKRLTPRFSWTI